ncbi:MAG: aminoglycoside phosphotransferase family protein [Chloroflexota bacterium]
MPDEHFLYMILPHPTEARILALAHDSGWTLPQLQPEGDLDDVFDFFRFGMKTESVLGCTVRALYCPYVDQANDAHGHRFVFVLETRDPAFQPPGNERWIGSDEINDLAPEYLRPTLETYFRERATGVYPPERAPWAFPGWLDAAHGWIKEQAAANGWTLDGEIEVVRKWCITAVLRAPTSAGNLYFKAVPPTFARETAITRLLIRHCPTHIPTLVASQDASHWLLMRDFGGTLLGESKDVADWERALHDFAALQVTMSGQIEALFQCDAMDYRLEVLPEKLDVLLADEEILKPNHQITAEEIERARQLAPRIKALIAELQGYRLPATVVHSDFHPWNTAVNEDRIIFFDWTEAAVGHPFSDLAQLSLIAPRIFPDQPETIAHLREAYLEGWTSFAPLETLRKALLLGEALGVLQKAITYRHLLRCLEPNERWSLDNTGGAVKDLLTKVEALQEV